jgi:hypothetical protein
VAKFRKRQVI